MVFREPKSDAEHVAMVMGEVAGDDVPVRIHSECLTTTGHLIDLEADGEIGTSVA